MGEQQHYEQIGVAMTCRGYAEYERMFGLDAGTLERGAILDVAAGASSFAAEAKAKGADVRCADPRYAMTALQIGEEGYAEIETSTNKLERLAERFDWSYYGDSARHKAGRLRSLDLFIQDFNRPEARESYVPDALPNLSFADDRFSLVLCSHFLFLYGDQFDEAFHRDAVTELLRVCRPGGEVRIYPLLSLRWEPYPGLERLMRHLETLGASCELRKSALPFIPGSTDMLVIDKK
ncbi:methylase [Paenibacillus hodogayensis]|uniref:Methylase n=1 Tax=Paenibacillus hodogayensis TaxID=279208 RepID=A0ABV5VX45_9BACL